MDDLRVSQPSGWPSWPEKIIGRCGFTPSGLARTAQFTDAVLALVRQALQPQAAQVQHMEDVAASMRVRVVQLADEHEAIGPPILDGSSWRLAARRVLPPCDRTAPVGFRSARPPHGWRPQEAHGHYGTIRHVSASLQESVPQRSAALPSTTKVRGGGWRSGSVRSSLRRNGLEAAL
jgi:hypothetical protein